MLSLEEAYERFGGGYSETLERMTGERLIRKYLARLEGDTSYADLEKAMEEDNDAAAFEAVHTLKGVSMSLGLRKLTASAGALTEALRNGRQPGADALFEEVRRDYKEVLEVIAQLQL